MLGYDVDFGHVEMINLLSSPKYTEKSVGYIAVSLMIKPTDELMTLVVNSVRNDLISPNPPGQCLSLQCIANMGGIEFTQTVGQDVKVNPI